MKKRIIGGLKFTGTVALCLVCSVLLGTLLLTAVYMLPTEPMDKNLGRSAEVFQSEGVRPDVFKWCSSRLDNYTDSFILLLAVYDGGESPLVEAMELERNHITTQNSPTADIVAHYINGEEFDTFYGVSRYWGGFLVYTKPLLLLTTYQNIRIINGVCQTLAFAAVIFLLVKQGFKRYIAPYCLAVAFLMPVTLAMSLQYSPCYYIMTFGCIALLLMRRRSLRRVSLLFLFIGIATVYFDFLTYPIATVGVPLALYFAISERKGFLSDCAYLVLPGACWGVGYGGMWLGKWITVSIVTKSNAFVTVLRKIRERTDNDPAEFAGKFVEDPSFTAIKRNIKAFIKTPVSILAFALVIALALLILYGLFTKRLPVSELTVAVPFAVLALLPMVWYWCTANHSLIHYWFTHKALVSTAFSGMCVLTRLAFRIKLKK